MKIFFLWFYLVGLITGLHCKNGINNNTLKSQITENSQTTTGSNKILCGADQPEKYLPLLKNKRVGLIVNHTSLHKEKHLVDFLISERIQVNCIFAPEHGFRGNQADGAVIKDDLDPSTGIPIISLYGNKKAPTSADLKNVDILVFDIQDVGTRFYTFLSTLKYVMEAAAENNKALLILDRPNPNGWYVDGPILEPEFTSFVGVIPIPVVHGMTLAELGKMMNGEKWLKDQLQCKLTIITCENYNHSLAYHLTEKPSPNLPNDVAIALYPSLCFFEATNVSVGRGTNKQFQIYGSPWLPETGFSFTPKPNSASPAPILNGEKCNGVDLTRVSLDKIRKSKKINLSYLIQSYQQFSDKSKFFLPGSGFEKLVGNRKLREQLKQGVSEEVIRKSWEPALGNFKSLRLKYLIYPD